QAEDGIRDRNVTGVQTCALPIYYLIKNASHCPAAHGGVGATLNLQNRCRRPRLSVTNPHLTSPACLRRLRSSRLSFRPGFRGEEIGRASCREGVESQMVSDLQTI